ncbi:MAG TPA: SpoIIE family protein phosphatase, partial [Nitrosopumilaceae archaeon]|nr:SpoIIE family protein phosphatase [Nitrosopumilaceae archaeon]
MRKGFKDYGIEGLMRIYAHRLMETKYQSVKYATLMLRRHEKDFIIRKDEQYFNKFILVSDELKRSLFKEKIPKADKKSLFNNLLNYRHHFIDYFNVQYEIGTTENEGFLFRLNGNYLRIDRLFDLEKIASVKVEEQYSSTLKYYNIILVCVSVILSLLFSFAYSFQISNRTVKLKNSIENYVNSGFKEWPKFDKSIKITELVVIAKGFNKMAVEINSYLNFFKVKVEERTLEITRQKEELQQQSIKIQIQHDLLLEHKNKLEEQRFLLAEKNQDFTDSVTYAERIQKAILPPLSEFKNEFSDSFIYYLPKDIVSGDFYWLDSVMEEKKIIREHELSFHSGIEENIYIDTEFRENLQSKKILFAVADCTGHGVPGAFMSIVGSNHLNKIVKEHQVYEPSEVLTHLNNEIMSTFRQDNGEPSSIKDGMEIAFCSYDTSNNILGFCGANKTLYLIR